MWDRRRANSDAKLIERRDAEGLSMIDQLRAMQSNPSRPSTSDDFTDEIERMRARSRAAVDCILANDGDVKAMLGLTANTHSGEVMKASRHTSKLIHPDKVKHWAGSDTSLEDSCVKAFKTLQNAVEKYVAQTQRSESEQAAAQAAPPWTAGGPTPQPARQSAHPRDRWQGRLEEWLNAGLSVVPNRPLPFDTRDQMTYRNLVERSVLTWVPWENSYMCRICNGGGGWGKYVTVDNGHLTSRMHVNRMKDVEYSLRVTSCPNVVDLTHADCRRFFEDLALRQGRVV